MDDLNIKSTIFTEEALQSLKVGRELISKDRLDRVLRVPGGYIYRTVGQSAKGVEMISTAVFVPIPKSQEIKID